MFFCRKFSFSKKHSFTKSIDKKGFDYKISLLKRKYDLNSNSFAGSKSWV